MPNMTTGLLTKKNNEFQRLLQGASTSHTCENRLVEDKEKAAAVITKLQQKIEKNITVAYHPSSATQSSAANFVPSGSQVQGSSVEMLI